MTRVQILEDQKAIFVAQKEELGNQRNDIYVREEKACSDALLPFFVGFSPYASIEVLRGSIYFKMDHPEYGYKKDLFSIYLRESYFEEGKRFSGVDLSYYTTSTKGDDLWELRRLRMLGDLADIVLKSQHDMLDAVNYTVHPFKEEYARVSEQVRLIGEAIKDLDQKIFAFKKERILFDLVNEGIEFSTTLEVKMKYNYTPRIVSLKLIDASKSGRKATAVFEFQGGHISREEGVSVDSITNQVLGLSNHIIQSVLTE